MREPIGKINSFVPAWKKLGLVIRLKLPGTYKVISYWIKQVGTMLLFIINSYKTEIKV